MNTERSMCQPSDAVDVVVIGAGHCGLAMSYMLARSDIEHVVLERGEVANSWRTERWDSMRLLTPNWMTRLPGREYGGHDPDGYMSASDVASWIGEYATSTSAPVLTNTSVIRVSRCDEGYRVLTTRGELRCRALVLATGAFNAPDVPKVAEGMPSRLTQLTPHDYRGPSQLGEGRVLVVGASATGVQLAQEIAGSGRSVTVATGEHVRMPRMYRGRDIQWWMLAAGVLDQGLDDVDDIRRARRVASPQLVGSAARASVDLNSLQAQGVELVGRVAAVRDGKALLSGSLRNVCTLADLKMNRLLDAIDEWAEERGLASEVAPPERYEATRIGRSPRLSISLSDEIETVIWATGFKPDYSWLDVPVVQPDGHLRHEGGVVDAPGLYALGLPFLRRRKSSFIHGAEDDARDIARHLAGYLDLTARRSVAAHHRRSRAPEPHRATPPPGA